MKDFYKKSAFWIFAGVACIFMVLGIVGYFQYTKVNSELSRLRMSATNTEATSSEVAQLIEDVGKLIMLPEEKPTIASVTDAEKLKSQPFFHNAQKGDILLLYKVAKRALLYRPKTGKIINMEVAIAQEKGAATASTGISAVGITGAGLTEMKDTPASVAGSLSVYNVTGEIAFMDGYISGLRVKVPGLRIVSVENAASRAYDASMLVSMPWVDPGMARAASKKLGLPLADMPVAEASPASDFLIIVGKDKK